MINSRRLIIIVITLNLLLGTFTQVYDQNKTEDLRSVQKVLRTHYNLELEFEDEDTLEEGVKNENLQEQSTPGSSLSWFTTVYNIFIKSLNPVGLSPWQFENPVERTFAWFLTLIRTLLHVVVMIEIVYIIKNKKVD